MKLSSISIRNFRRLSEVKIEFDTKETLLVGPNNSGKTSATAAIRSFLGNREFKIHDFSVPQISKMDLFNLSHEDDAEVKKQIEEGLPSIELDLWFAIDTSSIAFGKVFALSSALSDDFSKIGVQCVYSCEDLGELWRTYQDAYPIDADLDNKRAKSLSQFLEIDGNLKSHFGISFYSLEEGNETPRMLEPALGRKTLKSLIRADFVDAQRNIDEESAARSNKLSEAFASYYRSNLTQADTVKEAVKVIDENNNRLTQHYEKNFAPLISRIKGLGVPSVNDRELKIVSSISSDSALKGNTNLFYRDPESSHELPESYNGLGFKNLVYMAVQIDHFHRQWINTEDDRPLCQVIFIEEPEVHLHAQVQQTFVKNMWEILNASTTDHEETPQLAITTHSSHILETIDFSKVRYFRRCPLHDAEGKEAKIFNASEIHNLAHFQPEEITQDGKTLSSDEVLLFLQKYLRLSHCDLFFADAAILVEGSVEKLIIPKMIDKHTPVLNEKYLTILELGGAYAHRFGGLLQFLHIPYLIITDIDSVNPADNRKACPALTPGAVTSNATIKSYFSDDTIDALSKTKLPVHEQAEGLRFITYQRPRTLKVGEVDATFHGRTLEETFVFENLELFKSGSLSIGIEIPDTPEEISKDVYDRIRNNGFKKTQFALDLLISDVDWETPMYILIGLLWLNSKLTPPKPAATSEEE